MSLSSHLSGGQDFLSMSEDNSETYAADRQEIEAKQVLEAQF